MRRLPPLGAIEAFVQVARLGSAKAAAEELSLSPPALSRRIQALERFVGKPLFHRGHQSMIANGDGERLLGLIAPVLDRLSDAVEAISGAEVVRLRLAVLPLFASQRLLPHLPQLRGAHPELHLDIDTMGHGIARLGDGVDAVIALAREIDPTLYARRLGRNAVRVIGARSLAEGPDPLVRPEQLAGQTVLVHRDMTDMYAAWMLAAGIADVEPLAVDQYDSGQLMLEAAAQGLGVAFMLDSHFDDANDPRLAPLFDVEVESPQSYWFVCRPRALQLKAVRIFHDWLVEALGAE